MYEDQTSIRNIPKCSDFLQNADKIETICESTSTNSGGGGSSKNTGSKSNLISGGFSIAHIKQHFFDSNKNSFTQNPPRSKRKR